MLTGTPHFTLAEVQRNTQWPIPEQYQDNAQATLEELENVRDILGAPMRLTSLWRSSSSNALLPGSANASQHLSADGADFVPIGITLREAGERWLQAVQDGRTGDFHQFIVEEQGDDGLGAHIHYGRGVKRESLVRLASGQYTWLTDWLATAQAKAEEFFGQAAEAVQENAPSVLGVALAAGFRRCLAVVRHGLTWTQTSLLA